MTTMPRTALITGAARRIGRQIALGLAEDGFALALHSHNSREEAKRLAADINAAGGRAIVLEADLGAESEVDQLVPNAVAALGPLGLLVNNAAMFVTDEAQALVRAVYDRQLAVNLTTPIFLSNAFAAALPPAHEGLIVNLIDQRVLKLNPQFFSYTLAKSALWTATRTLAQSLAPRIRVNAIAPGPAQASTRQRPEDFQRQQQATLLGRGPELGEFSDCLRLFIRARSLTGQMIALDGGQHLNWQTPDTLDMGE